MRKFLFLTDLHWGYERLNGKKVPLHDPKALAVALKFASDFQPDDIILGGDILDCGAVSHHNRHKPGNTEGLRLLADATECHREVVLPLDSIGPKHARRTFITGNHEDWLNDLIVEMPSLEGIVHISSLLGLERWKVIPQGGFFNMGKLTFLHGDTVKGGEHVAKAAVINYERNVRFGHHHTHQVYTKNSPLDYKNAKTGMAVPCLCSKSPKYGESKPNRWLQGFNYGYVHPDGSFHDYVATIVNGRCAVNGRLYKG